MVTVEKGKGQNLARSYPLDIQSSALAPQGLDSAGHLGELWLAGTIIMLVGCWQKGGTWKEKR